MAADYEESAIPSQGSWSPWHCSAHPPGSITDPSQLPRESKDWIPATVPGTVAGDLAAIDRWTFESPAEIDKDDWWFRSTLQVPIEAMSRMACLIFEGLATLAEVWLNGELLLTSDNMFRSHRVDVSSRLRGDNELVLGFRSVTENLKQKRPRPRWKTNLVNNQQLRWLRGTLQGRIPGWSPPAPAIGPWRGIRLEIQPVSLHSVHLKSRLDNGCGIVTFDASVVSAGSIESASLRVGTHVVPLRLLRKLEGNSLHGELRIDQPNLWWPHTHGQPDLYECEVVVESGGRKDCFPCAPIGFRQLEIETTDGFRVRANGQSIYCRGACWTVCDILTLSGTEEQLRHDLTLARDAGANMLRVGGTMVYESDTFYRLCDELGILVWQDFMFANMDYPVDDVAFRKNVVAEATEQLTRLAAHPCVAVYCGNSEIEQQAAMLGMPREMWTNSWFTQDLPELVRHLHPGTGYVPSTPTGGVLPFQPNTGLTHYYGVGAYLRPVTDVRRSDVKFTPECLGFSNVPEAVTIDAIMQVSNAVTHDPRWKRRVPRDSGAGWDFEDVRDHYLREVYLVDPVQLRSWDSPKYLQLSRLVTGEMMQQTFSEWRSGHGSNRGGLVWFYKDLWPAAGWGILDSTGTPKAAYYALKRIWKSRQLVLTDEGLNGLQLHLVNEGGDACDGFLEVQLLKGPDVVIARQEIPVQIEGRASRTLSADEILGGFYDVSYAYRFGRPHHDVVVATWFDADRNVVSEAFHFIRRGIPALERNVVLETSAAPAASGDYRITLRADRFLQSVQVSASGFLPDDNYFHLAPNRTKSVTFRPRQPASRFKAMVEALNMDASHIVTVRPTTT
ncbi:MAG: glycoside hydrolase family 2 protein [Planctomycetes bacterium]|nr:glycoside hydrolase family 2 protein [Planctomycetota bacterium]